jgi:hypothetical protein
MSQRSRPGEVLELDDNFKRLIHELGQAINDSLSESNAISDVMARIRSSGYDLFLVLDVTIGFNKQPRSNVSSNAIVPAKETHRTEFHLTNQDAQFLRALKISVEDQPQ